MMQEGMFKDGISQSTFHSTRSGIDQADPKKTRVRLQAPIMEKKKVYFLLPPKPYGRRQLRPHFGAPFYNTRPDWTAKKNLFFLLQMNFVLSKFTQRPSAD
jgi:hypothetical protein